MSIPSTDVAERYRANIVRTLNEISGADEFAMPSTDLVVSYLHLLSALAALPVAADLQSCPIAAGRKIERFLVNSRAAISDELDTLDGWVVADGLDAAAAIACLFGVPPNRQVGIAELRARLKRLSNLIENVLITRYIGETTQPTSARSARNLN